MGDLAVVRAAALTGAEAHDPWSDPGEACRRSLPDALDSIERESRDAPVAHAYFVEEVARRFGFPRNQVRYGTRAYLAFEDDQIECDFRLSPGDPLFPFAGDEEGTVHLLGYSDRDDGFEAQTLTLYVANDEERRTPLPTSTRCGSRSPRSSPQTRRTIHRPRDARSPSPRLRLSRPPVAPAGLVVSGPRPPTIASHVPSLAPDPSIKPREVLRVNRRAVLRAFPPMRLSGESDPRAAFLAEMIGEPLDLARDMEKAEALLATIRETAETVRERLAKIAFLEYLLDRFEIERPGLWERIRSARVDGEESAPATYRLTAALPGGVELVNSCADGVLLPTCELRIHGETVGSVAMAEELVRGRLGAS